MIFDHEAIDARRRQRLLKAMAEGRTEAARRLARYRIDRERRLDAQRRRRLEERMAER